jgi:hypothetical protein
MTKKEKTLAEVGEESQLDYETDHLGEILRRARALHRRAAQAGVSDVLVAALLVSDALESAARKIK